MTAPRITTLNPGPVISAGRVGSIRAALSSQPNVRDVLLGWFKSMIVQVVTTEIEGRGPRQGEAKSGTHDVNTSGLRIPGDDEKLETGDSAGERSWASWTLYTFPNLDLATDTQIKIEGVLYRVMKRRDFSANGYIRYGLVEDFQ